MELNAAINDYLKNHGIKKSFLADRCGWSRVRVSCILNGKQKISAEDLRQICEALGVGYDYFYHAAKRVE